MLGQHRDVFLALTEIRRAKARFGLLAGAIGLLVLLILFQQALLTGLINQFIGAIKNQSAEVLVFNDQARQNLEGSVVFPAQQEQIAAIDGVADAQGIGEGTFTVSAGGEEVEAVVFGYTLGGPGEPTTLVDGRLPDGPNEAVASIKDRDDGFDIGDQVRVLPDAGTITIVGLADTINYSVSPTMFVDFDTYAALRLARNPDAAFVPPSVIGVDVADGRSPADVAAAINASVEGVEALTRQDAVDKSPGVSSVRSSFTIILLLFYLVVPLVTGLFFLIVTLQKASALTLLRAIGARSSTLVRSLLAQVALVVMTGVALATIAFAALVPVASSLGLQFRWTPVIATTVAILTLALLTSLFAARRVLRIDPIAATTGAGVKA